jgi:DNA-binding NarL/FixJ family response regulator
VDGAAAAAACVATRADVVVMDYRLPGLDGAAATAAVREASPHVAVVCLTAEATAEEQQKVLRAGAVALVEKSQPIEELAAAIRSAARREPVWS